MDALEPLEQLAETFEVLSKMLLEMALPSAQFIMALTFYSLILYIGNILGVTSDTPIYGMTVMDLSDALWVGISLLGLAGTLSALRHLEELPF
ncbi:hypothetical protein ADU37_CDS05020 [Thermococcus sp. 2319x1]|uniref:hypothetical protein n=1 Tax=Thermococcus sp. 2319x1 TaxID=1674923 RepID=UPI00073AD5F7|nr:hypothetical protein [Thermococcus sp. 2319x1]ALV62201.1 hypothetical protein ADU37_CDS05020 [Thermococcus sp. 2319x1]